MHTDENRSNIVNREVLYENRGNRWSGWSFGTTNM